MAYPTFDPAETHADITLSGGNLIATSTTANFRGADTNATFRSTGKWYCEFVVGALPGNVWPGIVDSAWSPTSYVGSTAGSYGLDSGGGALMNSGGVIATYGAYTTADVIGIRYDGDADTIQYYKNNVSMGTAVAVTASSYRPASGLYWNGTSITVNFGATAFTYSLPAGYSAWDNPDPVIHNDTMAGGVLVGAGSAEVYGVADIGSGGVLIGGTATEYAVASELPSGGVLVGGSAVEETILVAYAAVTLEQRTSTGVASSGTRGVGAVLLKERTATSEARSGTVAAGAVTLPTRTAFGASPMVVSCVLEKRTATSEALNGTLATGSAVLRARSATGEHLVTGLATGTAQFQERIATGVSLQENPIVADVVLMKRQAAGSSVGGTAGVGAVVLKPRTAFGVASFDSIATGAAIREKLLTNGYSEPALASTYRTWVMNVANDSLTEYTNHTFNSYANFNDLTYAAGPGGLFQLTGDTDNSADISWVMRTGFIDDKNPQLKRVNEIIMGLRHDAPVRVRVWTDEITYYDYTLANYRETLQQVRIKTGKGLRSKHYCIELTGMGGESFEIDSLQVPFIPVTRRIG